MNYITTTEKRSHMKNRKFVVTIPDGKVVLDVKVLMKQEKQICPLCKKRFYLYSHLKNKHKFSSTQAKDIIKNLKPELHMKVDKGINVKDFVKDERSGKDILMEVLSCANKEGKTMEQ